MSFPRYPAYMDSGVEWLGEVPEHWEIKPNKAFLSLCRSEVGHTSAEKTLLSLTLNGVVPRDLESGKGKFPTDFGTYQDVNKGDLVFCLFDIDETPRTVGLAQESGMITGAYDVLRCKESVLPEFVFSYYLHIDSFKGLKPFYTGLRKVVRPPTFMAVKVPIPPIHEQTQIVTFLDHETAKIDALVAEQRRLMELLKEKRQAVISHAVTRGLNPNALMKSSGIEWLGDVPEHWELKRLKYLGEAITGLTYSPSNIVEDELTGTLVLRSSNVQGGVITFDDNVYVSAAIPEELVTRIGDILICSRNGSRALIGKNATINEHSAGLTFGAFMTVFRSPHYEYLSCVLNSPLFEFQAGAFMTSTINQLTIGVLNNFEVPLPPERERENIAEFLAIESAKFNTLITEAQRAIDLLQERRTALISAAVTGQIDVRGAVQAL